MADVDIGYFSHNFETKACISGGTLVHAPRRRVKNFLRPIDLDLLLGLLAMTL